MAVVTQRVRSSRQTFATGEIWPTAVNISSNLLLIEDFVDLSQAADWAPSLSRGH